MLNKVETKVLETRPYQKEAILSVLNFTKDFLRGLLVKDKEKIFQNAMPLTMATGSGKTYSTGTILDKIFKLRNRFNSIYKTNHFENLNIIVLADKINLL